MVVTKISNFLYLFRDHVLTQTILSCIIIDQSNLNREVHKKIVSFSDDTFWLNSHYIIIFINSHR